MKWQIGRRSTNVEDQRQSRVGTGVKLGGGAILLVAVVALLLGEDPRRVLTELAGQSSRVDVGAGRPGPAPADPAADQAADFVSVVLASTEDVWGAVFARSGKRYQPPKLVLFTDAVDSACGFASAAVGPFYCPADRKAYLDLGFFRELDRRFGAPGDFAQAYVVAHEIGHHVQNLLGISAEVERLGDGLDREGRNALSVRQELQADCLAGVWGHDANLKQQLLEPGDAEEGLAAASAIGDDRLQRESRGRVQPESWTHGSSEMRVAWLRRGLDTGSVEACDTFSGR